MPTDNSPYLNADQVRDHFGGASKTWLWAAVRRGDIPKPDKIGGKTLWSRKSLTTFDEQFFQRQNKKVA